ncbi:hypothetical protein Acr_10g0007810 [Actinidia rufa]|uniref:Uncharacterized protein n=1 Tax=Actinidia rufa TaxID=165716 RepID=A0A7J0FAE4_9ERIC|nr:hypothetical protein Acr_10g0007810 [Actinidia rufa]
MSSMSRYSHKGCQREFCRVSYLLSPDTPRERRLPWPNFGAVTPTELAIERQFRSDVGLSLDSASTWQYLDQAPAQGPSSLFHSDSPTAVPALARPEIVVVYFIH